MIPGSYINSKHIANLLMIQELIQASEKQKRKKNYQQICEKVINITEIVKSQYHINSLLDNMASEYSQEWLKGKFCPLLVGM